jgi:glycine cleavage system H lipoate-binding protein
MHMASSIRLMSQMSRALIRQPISPIHRCMSTRPRDYNHKHFWLKKVEGNEYAFGIKMAFMEEYDEPEMVVFDSELFDVLQKGDEFGAIENTKSVQIMEAPFNNCVLFDFSEDIDFNADPENIDNRLCTFREENEEVCVGEQVYFRMPLL